jgi:formiminotetrahydrofolate cyclodeaminase
MIDPSTPPHIVTAVAALAGAFAGALASGVFQLAVQWRKNVAERKLAELKFNHERQQAIFKRKFELAELWLSDTYRFREIMGFVRNGVAFDGEGKQREPMARDGDSISRLKDTYFVPMERIQKQHEFLAAFMTKQHACQALFGTKAKEAFDKCDEAIRHLRAASITLIGMVQPEGHFSDRELGERLLGDIWAGHRMASGQEDRILAMINRAVEVAETLTKPILEFVDKP